MIRSSTTRVITNCCKSLLLLRSSSVSLFSRRNRPSLNRSRRIARISSGDSWLTSVTPARRVGNGLTSCNTTKPNTLLMIVISNTHITTNAKQVTPYSANTTRRLPLKVYRPLARLALIVPLALPSRPRLPSPVAFLRLLILFPEARRYSAANDIEDHGDQEQRQRKGEYAVVIDGIVRHIPAANPHNVTGNCLRGVKRI